MNDTVYLLVNDKRIELFESYTIDADLYCSDDAFELELGKAQIATIKAGMRCELYVNDVQELTGIIDRVNPSYDKTKQVFKVVGRSLMGLLTDSHCEEFLTLTNYDLKSLTERLIKKVPFIQREMVVYQENVKGRIRKKGKSSRVQGYDTVNAFSQIHPGMSIFEVLKEYAKSRGLLFFGLPDGTFVFGKPKEEGDPAFQLSHRLSGVDNNILAGELIQDMSKRYSKVTVVGQKQGTEGYSAADITREATKEFPLPDPDFIPIYKPYVLKDEYGGMSPDLQARMTLEKMRYDAFRLSYKVQGHSQGVNNWSINELCTVIDENPAFDLKGKYLLYGRTFKKSKDQGTTTELRLGYPGMIA
jgi:prophage tail gpP-like protein